MTLIDRTFRERIVLVGVVVGDTSESEATASLDELSQLVDTAGADEVARVVQRRRAPDPAYYIGKGKLDELVKLSYEVDADTVVFDDELTPAQQRNLTNRLGRTAIDRTSVILDIFAQNAVTPEGKAQVELALLRYRLPFLRGKGLALSQQAGGIGTRGPGETKLETDRRRLLRRMTRLEKDLEDLEEVRATQRRARQRSSIPSVSIVGYTNAGKSSLLNRYTEAGVLVEDRLFATLDPRIRRLRLPRGPDVLLSDTVGFVRKLPHQLIQAFHSTLEVVAASDLLIHLVDASSPDPQGTIAAVHTVLGEIGAADVPSILVFNKSDVVDPDTVTCLVTDHPGALAISAATGEGTDELLSRISWRLNTAGSIVALCIPYDRGDVLAAVYRSGTVLDEENHSDGTYVRARLDPRTDARFDAFVVGPDRARA